MVRFASYASPILRRPVPAGHADMSSYLGLGRFRQATASIWTIGRHCVEEGCSGWNTRDSQNAIHRTRHSPATEQSIAGPLYGSERFRVLRNGLASPPW